jgi:hypothetical protein
MSRKHKDNLPDKKIPGAGKRHSAERINQQKKEESAGHFPPLFWQVSDIVF